MITSYESKKGEFSVKSAYYVALPIIHPSNEGESSRDDPRSLLWKRMWHLNIPAKIRIFAWCACMNALPIMHCLRTRGVSTYGICPVCDLCPESTLHALIQCDTPKEVWSSCLNCPVDWETNSGDFTDLAFQFITNGTTQDLETFFVTAWPIWYNQNQMVHESTSSLPIQIWGTTRRTVKDYKGALINCISAEIQLSFVLDCPTSWHSQI